MFQIQFLFWGGARGFGFRFHFGSSSGLGWGPGFGFLGHVHRGTARGEIEKIREI